MIDDRELRHRPLVELQKRDARRVGTPPVALPHPAAIDLFLINVVQLSVEDLRAAVGGELPLADIAGREIDDEEVVVPEKRDLLPVGTERRFLFRARRRGHARNAPLREVVDVEIVGEIEQDRRFLRVERQLIQVRDLEPHILERLLQLRLVKERALLPRLDIEETPLDEISVFVRLRPNERRVVDPIKPTLNRPAEIDLVRGVIEGVEGELFFLGEEGGCEEEDGRESAHAARTVAEGIGDG